MRKQISQRSIERAADSGPVISIRLEQYFHAARGYNDTPPSEVAITFHLLSLDLIVEQDVAEQQLDGKGHEESPWTATKYCQLSKWHQSLVSYHAVRPYPQSTQVGDTSVNSGFSSGRTFSPSEPDNFEAILRNLIGSNLSGSAKSFPSLHIAC